RARRGPVRPARARPARAVARRSPRREGARAGRRAVRVHAEHRAGEPDPGVPPDGGVDRGAHPRSPAPDVARRRVGDPAGPPHGGPHGVPHDRPLARPLTFTRVDVSGTVSPDPSYKWTGAHPASMKMHSPVHSSADSMTPST